MKSGLKLKLYQKQTSGLASDHIGNFTLWLLQLRVYELVWSLESASVQLKPTTCIQRPWMLKYYT